LWFILDDPHLSTTAREIISDPARDIAVSPATYWEIAIKISLGKDALPESYGVFIEREIECIDAAFFNAYPVTRLW
jgi:PIN domain nuclease of toxin-antitoxin system